MYDFPKNRNEMLCNENVIDELHDNFEKNIVFLTGKTGSGKTKALNIFLIELKNKYIINEINYTHKINKQYIENILNVHNFFSIQPQIIIFEDSDLYKNDLIPILESLNIKKRCIIVMNTIPIMKKTKLRYKQIETNVNSYEYCIKKMKTKKVNTTLSKQIKKCDCNLYFINQLIQNVEAEIMTNEHIFDTLKKIVNDDLDFKIKYDMVIPECFNIGCIMYENYIYYIENFNDLKKCSKFFTHSDTILSQIYRTHDWSFLNYTCNNDVLSVCDHINKPITTLKPSLLWSKFSNKCSKNKQFLIFRAQYPIIYNTSLFYNFRYLLFKSIIDQNFTHVNMICKYVGITSLKQITTILKLSDLDDFRKQFTTNNKRWLKQSLKIT